MNAKLQSENLILYSEGLTELTDIKLTDLAHTGEFGKKILIITNSIAVDSEEQILLDKMLKATSLSLADIYHIQLTEAQPMLRLISKLKPDHVLCFGGYLNSSSTNFSNKLYKPNKVNDIQILMTHGLHKIKDDNELKQALWNGLKKMFNL